MNEPATKPEPIDLHLRVKHLRELLATLPDDALILPDWHNVPNDNEPGIELHEVTIEENGDGEKYVSLKMSLFYLNDDEPDEDDPYSVAHVVLGNGD